MFACIHNSGQNFPDMLGINNANALRQSLRSQDFLEVAARFLYVKQ
ncbi:hypothetical protein [Pleurocapsa sp. FMAR1]|nr:hypothetical protein [Pleurocapsa sp. FMAR1]